MTTAPDLVIFVFGIVAYVLGFVVGCIVATS
jgi:hypothetical protein